MSRVTDFEVKWRKQKQIEEAEKKQKEEAKNTSVLETFSPQKYNEMKKNGQIVFDTDIVDNYFSNGYDYVNEIKNNIANPSYINSKTFPNSERYGNINNNSDYVRLYIESLKGTDEYDSLKKQYDDYNSAMSYYNNAAKQMKDFASIFGDEEHYNNAIKDIQNSETEEDKILKYIAYISGRKTFGDESFSDTLSNSNNISLPKSFTTGTQGLNGKEEVLKYWNVLSYAKDPNLLFNADMSKQYGDYSYTDLIKEAEKYKSSPKEYNWIKNRAETVATSEDLQAEYDSLTSEYNNLYDSFRRSDYGLTKDEKMGSYANWSEVSDRMSEIEKRKENLSTLIEKKKYEEKKKAEYDDVIENDANAKDVLQKYYALTKSKEQNTANADEAPMPGVDYTNYNYTSEDEAQITNAYNELAKKYDVDKLYKYHDRIEQEKANKEYIEALRESAKQNPVGTSIASIMSNTYGTVGDVAKYVEAWGDKKFSGGDGYIDVNSTASARAEAVRGSISENMDGFGKFLYNTAMGIGDNIARMPLLALPGGKTMSLALAGTSAGTAAANDVINSGGSLENALLTAVAAGTAEVVFEKIPLDELIKLKNEGTASVRKAILKQMATEGLEEVGTDIANALTDSIINGDMAQLAQKYNAYIEQGLSESEAWGKTTGDFVFELFQDFSAGAISGGVLSGGAIGLNYATNKIENVELNNKVGEAVKENENVSGLIETAKKLSPKSKAYKVATQLEKQQKNNKKISSSKVGQLRSLIIEQSKTEFETEYKNVTNNLHPEEKTVVDKLLNREALSEDEVKIVKDNDFLTNSITDLQKTFNNLYSNAEKADKSPFEAIKSIDDNTDKIDESKLNVSQDGKTKINDEAYDGPMEVVRTNPFAETVTYKIEKNGEIVEVSSENIEFKTKEEAKLSALASKYNVQTAQKFLDLYESGQDVNYYSEEFNLFQNYGRLAVPLTDDKMNTGFNLNPDQKMGAYEAGLTSRKSYYQEQNILSSNAKNSKYYAYTKGKFNASAIKDIQLDETQRAFYNFLREFALRTGINVELFSSKEETGKYQGEQGSWDKNTKTIRIDINAGLKNVSDRVEIKHGMLNTFAHELTHIAENSGFYDELHEAIVNALEKRGTSFDELVKAKKDELVNNTPNAKTMSDEKLTYLADVEVIANNCETMLKNSKIFEDIAQGNPGLAQKLKDKLKNFIARLKQLLSKTNALTHEGKLLEACVTEFEDIQKLWDKAVTDGIKTVNAIHAEQKNNTAENSDVKYSIRKTQNMSFSNQLELIENNKLNGSNSLYIGIPSADLIKVGFSKNPFAMNQKDYRKSRRDSAKNKHYSSHGVPLKFFKVLPQKLNSVAMLIDNGIKITAITDFEMKDTKGNKSFVVVGLWQNQEMESDKVNLVKSVYPLDDISERILNNAEQNKLVVINKNKAKNMLATIGIQPSEVSRILNLSNNSLSQGVGDVKYQSRNSDIDNKYLEAVKNNGYFDFNKEYDLWDKTNPRIKFTVGKTSNILQSIGVPYKEVVWDSSKIIKIKAKHPEMTDEIIKQVPQILEYPVVVMKSKTKVDRLTMFGEVYSNQNKPILAVLELNPISHDNIQLEQIKIASAYGKDNAQQLINTSDIVFVDENKNRVTKWEKRTGLQLPVGESINDSKNSISQKNKSVNNHTQKNGNKDDFPQFQMRPNDDFLFDDLFDDDGIVEQSVFEKAVKDNPDNTLLAVYQHAAKTAETAITQSNDVRLDEKAYLRVARRIMQEYDISRKLNKDFDTELAEKIRMHIGRIENGVADFESELDLIVKYCQEALLLSGHLDYESKQDERDFVFGLINGKRLLVTKNGEAVIKEEYGSIRNYQRKMFGHMYVTLESNLNKKKDFSKDGLYISDIIASVGEQYENLLHIDENADDDVGYLWLDNLVNNYLEPQLVNHYIDGYYENLDTAALEMAFDITTEIINAKASQAVSSNKPNHRRIRQLANAKKQANSEQKAVQSAKLESYKKQLNGSEVSDSNRHILADLLTDSAQNEEESNIITSYKYEIDTLDTLEERLYEINKKIKEISFKKGSDRSQLANLKEQKKKLKNKIERKDKQLLKLESMDIMKKLINSEKQKASAKSAEKARSKYQQKLKESKDKIIVAEREKRKTMVKGIREARDKKEIIRKTIKKIQDVDKLLNRSKADKTVKQGLRDTASSLISLKGILIDTNISNADIVRQGVETATTEEQKMLAEYKKLLDVIDTKLPELEKYRDNFKKQLAKRSDLSEVKRSEILKNEVEIKREVLIGAETRKVYQLNSELKDLFIRERKQFEQLKRAMVRPALSELSDKYKSIENAPEAYLRNSFDKNIIEAIDSFKEEIGGTIVKDMNIEQVQKLHDIVTMILTSIRNANKLFAEDMKLTCEETSSDVMNEILNVKGTKEIRNIIASKILDFQWRNLKPVYAFRLMGSKTFERIYWNLQKGGLKWYIDLAEAKQFKEKCEKKYGYKSFDFKKKFEFKAMDGSTFAIDLNLMMDIYALSRRPQALQHLLKGGFTFEKNSPDGKLKVRTGAKAYPLTMDTIQSIANSLSENEKSYAEEMQKYLSETMAKKGNEVSMALYGVEMFNEDTYWSISSSDTFLNVEENETTGEFKVKNSGFTKSTVRNASNPIVLKGFEESWCNHINQMSLYHAITLPLEDLTKVFNYNTGVRTSEENPTAVTGVRSVIKGAFGNSAEQYFRQFIRDLNGGIKEASRVGIADNMIALAKKGAVLANFSVTLQQFSSMFRSMAYVDAKYFLPEPNKLVRLQNHRKDWEQLKKYAPIAGIKEMGMFDTGIGKGVLKWLSSGERDTTVKKAKNWVDDKISKPPALMDEYAWIKIWHAIQRETRVKHGFAIGTEENLVKSGERFNEVIHLTQVYDSVFSRSSAMRSNQTFEKMVTSFMAEPTTIMNMAVDAVAQLKRNGKSGIKQFAKSASAILISILANTLLMSIATAGRDDDEDETYGDKYLQSFCTNLINSAIPLNYYPIMRDIMSVLEGYTTERMDMSLVSDFVVSLKKLLKEDGATANNIIDFIGYIANLFGLPVRNVVRDFNAVINTYKTLTTASKDPITSLEMSMPTDYQEAYDKYWKDGYTEEDCKSRAITSVKAKIRKKLKPVYLEALKNQDSATVANIRRYMLDSGFYKSLNDVDEVLKGWRESSDEEDERTQRAEERK